MDKPNDVLSNGSCQKKDAVQFLKMPMHTVCLTRHFMTNCLVEFLMELIQALDLIYPNVRIKICLSFWLKSPKLVMGKANNKLNLLAASAIHDKDLLDPGSKLSNGWYHRFISRHRQLVLRKRDPTSNVRMVY